MQGPDDGRLTLSFDAKDALTFRPTRRVWVARVRGNTAPVVVQDAGFDASGPEGVRFHTLVRCATNVLWTRDLPPLSRFPGPLCAFDDCLDYLEHPRSLTAITRNGLTRLSRRVSHVFKYPYDLEYSIYISDLYGTVPIESWRSDARGQQCVIQVIDADMRDRRLRCRDAVTVLLSDGTKRCLPQRDIRILIAHLVWDSRKDPKWSPSDGGIEEPTAKRSRTE